MDSVDLYGLLLAQVIFGLLSQFKFMHHLSGMTLTLWRFSFTRDESYVTDLCQSTQSMRFVSLMMAVRTCHAKGAAVFSTSGHMDWCQPITKRDNCWFICAVASILTCILLVMSEFLAEMSVSKTFLLIQIHVPGFICFVCFYIFFIFFSRGIIFTNNVVDLFWGF